MGEQPTPLHTLRDCPQGPTIANINDTLKRVVDALEKVAATNVRISHVEEDNRLLRRENENLFGRMRDIEMLVGKDGNGFRLEVVQAMDEAKEEITASMTALKDSITKDIKPLQESLKGTTEFVAMLKGKRASYVYCALALMLVTGTACDIAYHGDFFLMTWNLLAKLKKSIT